MVTESEDRVVRLFHAIRDSPATSKTDDDEVNASAPAKFCEEGSQGVVCVFGGRAARRAYAQSGGVPETERLRLQEVPVVIACADGDSAHVTRCDSTVCADHQIDD